MKSPRKLKRDLWTKNFRLRGWREKEPGKNYEGIASKEERKLEQCDVLQAKEKRISMKAKRSTMSNAAKSY